MEKRAVRNNLYPGFLWSKHLMEKVVITQSNTVRSSHPHKNQEWSLCSSDPGEPYYLRNTGTSRQFAKILSGVALFSGHQADLHCPLSSKSQLYQNHLEGLIKRYWLDPPQYFQSGAQELAFVTKWPRDARLQSCGSGAACLRTTLSKPPC